MKQKMFLSAAAALVLLFLNLSPAWSQTSVLDELDPNILWVADSTIGRIDGFAVHPNGNIFAYFLSKIYEIDGSNGKLIRNFIIPNKSISSIDISDDGKYLATTYDRVIVTDLITLKFDTVGYGNLATFNSSSNKIAYAAISYPPGSMGHDSSIVILNLETQLRSYIKTEEMITKIAFSPDGRFFATGGSGQDVFGKSYTSLKLWDANTLKLIKELEKFEDQNYQIPKIEFSNLSRKVAFYGGMGIIIFDTDNYNIVKHYTRTGIGLNISRFTFLSEELLGIQSEKTSIMRISDDFRNDIYEFPERVFMMETNKERDILFIGPGSPNLVGSIVAFDLNKILSSVENNTENITIQASYQKGNLTITGIRSVGNQVNIEIFNINGKMVRLIKSQSIGNEMRVPLILPRGTYLLNITEGQNQYSSKFLVTE
ncbi:MAG: T9SS type A sorting domain-containing protein [Candidatus Kapabacteria bacterium]|nr:T9SS type A sorting domain-containing protein [Candidatus Kapabacteria bacterium]